MAACPAKMSPAGTMARDLQARGTAPWAVKRLPGRPVSGLDWRQSRRGRGLRLSVLAASATEHSQADAIPQVTHGGQAFNKIVEAFRSVSTLKERYHLLTQFAKRLPAFPKEDMVMDNRVMGCTAKVWVVVELDEAGCVQLRATSDSELTRGMCAILQESLSGLTPQAVLEFDSGSLKELGLGTATTTRSRTNGFLNMLETVHKRTRMLLKDMPTFPSLVISADSLVPQGAFAEAQALYLEPAAEEVAALASILKEKRVGVVAHFYMDPQVQGVLTAAADEWPHIQISDSLLMADAAVRMADAGCRYIAVLGVDFMSENVRAILDKAGHQDVQVYRMASASIGCSLAEAAESDKYLSYLSEAATVQPSLHVVYINTSLRTKAVAHTKVPTITCTSSNVVQTVLQAFAQVPGLNVWYGPDTYMGQNLVHLFQMLAQMSDEEIKEVHPEHNQESVRSLLPRLRHFSDGVCIVHHLFGGEVCQIVKEAYSDAYLTAHFEVPGELFELAMEAKKRGMGVVGSTSNILNFITSVLEDELADRRSAKLQFVLGTESGMITSIVKAVQNLLKAHEGTDLLVEIVFPVAPEAITTDRQALSDTVTLPGALQVIPGAARGEGCSLEGGCASCPYMKMNSLDALGRVLNLIGSAGGEALLEGHKPETYAEFVEDGVLMSDAGCQPILHMRGFQKSGKLPDSLVHHILSR
ncbi:unnamed protein product [Ostreobium quekettii]|uniref:Quinolinate synthase, chloroplastic n=1 Tax=Ostreobium quekettii TaxID=121088 RepID=A0A8S1J3I7_9CHLO|nr:unnamed protein product [Ostreobium quekettii]